MKKKALITGITGQDAFYLIKLLVRLNYEVHGIIRRSSNLNRDRLDRLDNYLLSINKKNLLKLHYGDLCDSSSVTKIFNGIRLTRSKNIIIWFTMLHHHIHSFHIIFCIAPIPFCI